MISHLLFILILSPLASFLHGSPCNDQIAHQHFYSKAQVAASADVEGRQGADDSVAELDMTVFTLWENEVDEQDSHCSAFVADLRFKTKKKAALRRRSNQSGSAFPLDLLSVILRI